MMFPQLIGIGGPELLILSVPLMVIGLIVFGVVMLIKKTS